MKERELDGSFFFRDMYKYFYLPFDEENLVQKSGNRCMLMIKGRVLSVDTCLGKSP